MKITFIIGLPASGKTILGQSLVDDSTLFIDDPTDLEWMNSVSHSHLVIADANLCNITNLDCAIGALRQHFGVLNINFIYFENDPVNCKINASKRVHKLVDNYIDLLTKLYKIPADVDPIPVYKCDIDNNELY